MDELVRFFSVLQRFNHNYPFSYDLIVEIETYFKRYWEDDKFLAIKSHDEREMLNQLPHHIQMKLIRDYLLNDFFKKFHRYFHIQRSWSRSMKAFYTWDDDIYCNFILQIVHALKPRYCESGQLVISQQNGIEEAIFIMKGKF